MMIETVKPIKVPLNEFVAAQLGDGVRAVLTCGRHEAYAAFSGPNNTIVGVVVLLRYLGREDDIEKVAYVVLMEHHNPRPMRCPQTILKKLSPAEKVYDKGTQPYLLAKSWRHRCQSYQRSKEVPVGAKVFFREPIRLSDGMVSDAFVRLPEPREHCKFLCLHNGREYRIPDWRTRSFEVDGNIAVR